MGVMNLTDQWVIYDTDHTKKLYHAIIEMNGDHFGIFAQTCLLSKHISSAH